MRLDRKSTRLNSSHMSISYAVFCLKKKRANAKKSPASKIFLHLRENFLHLVPGKRGQNKGQYILLRVCYDNIIFFFNDPATTEIYTLSLHVALPISRGTHNALGLAKSTRARFQLASASQVDV